MCKPEAIKSDIEEFVELLGKVRIPLEAIYSDEMKRIQREAYAINGNDERTRLGHA